MFNYGSFRLFLTKFVFGLFLLLFSISFLLSLISYDIADPGFNTYFENPNLNVNNYLGIFGANISSYSIVLIGNLSLIIGIFILFESIKLLLGIKNNLIVLKFFLNFFGVLLISVVLETNGIRFINNGIVSSFLSEIFNNFLAKVLNNKILFNFIQIVVFVIGSLFIFYSFSLKSKYLKKALTILKIFTLLKYLKYLIVLANFFRNKTIKIKSSRKNEPTIEKKAPHVSSKYEKNSGKNYRQLEIEQFKFSLPDTSLVLKSPRRAGANREIEKNNKEACAKLEQTLSEYGVVGKVVGYKTGPIVTLFEFIPNAGIKSSKVIGLSDDIARAMSSISARISSQPGKTSLGIEIPNSKRDDVMFGDLIEDDRFNLNKSNLTLALGKNISGEKVFTDLEKMPHLLIAGTTGSGKSVGINTMILSLLYKFKPNECKLILIDPKMLELSIYEDIPHLLTPVVTDPKKAVFALKWVVREMENRYKLMSSVNVKNIESYNNKVKRTISAGRKLFREVQTGIDSDTKMPIIEKVEIRLEKMPFIVVVIDEMADLMMVAGKEVESLVQRLAQMARASGIHLITATQRPSVDVITGTIKANFPSRISYKVASKFDSRTILNEMGAEQLLGSGDMLFLENGGNIKRLHGGFVSESEVEKVVSSIKEQSTFDYKKEISLQDIDFNQNSGNDLISGNNDELYNQAVEIIVKQQKVSTSYIQRYLQIGYNRAARIVEKMEEDGIITEANNAGKRHVLKKN